MYCLKCGYAVPENTAVCPCCGKQFKPPVIATQKNAHQQYSYVSNPPVQLQQQKKKSNISVIIGCVAGGILLLALLALLIGIIADDFAYSDHYDSDDIYVSDEVSSDGSHATANIRNEFVWVKQPFFVADDISVVHDYRSYIDTEYVAFYIDGNVGLMDTNGNIVCDPVYSDPVYCKECDGILFDYSYNANAKLFEFSTKHVVDHGGHGGGDGELLYDLNSRSFVYIIYGSGPIWEVDFDKSGCYVVYEAYKVLYDYSYEAYYDYDETGRVGLYNNGELVVPFEYELATDISEGVVGMFNGETWTYFSSDGSVILENVQTNGDVRTWSKSDLSAYNGFVKRNNEWVYEFSCGCVPVKKDGKWGYMNKNGEMIVDAQFDRALPAYENRAWVCVDGLWGIIELL